MLHKSASFLVVVLLLTLVGLVPVGAGTDQADTTRIALTAAADTYVESGGTENHGAETTLLSDFIELGYEVPLAPLHAQTGGAMNAAAEHGGRLWLGVGPRLIALDISDPAAPVRVGRTSVLPAVIEDLVIDPSRPVAWLAVGGWLVGVDIARSDHPAETARLALPGPARRIALAADHAWLLLDDGRVVGVDIADPGQPRLAAAIAAAGGTRAADVAGLGQRLFRLVVDEDSEQPPVVQVFDVSQPPAPSNLPPAVLDGLASPYYNGLEQLEWAQDRLWARVSGVLAAFRVEGDRLVEVGRDKFDLGGFDVTMAIAGDRAYVSLASGWSDNYGVAAFDISDPNDVRALTEPDWEIGRFPGVFSRAIAVVGDALWVASTGGFLTALDTRAASPLDTVGAYATVGDIEYISADAGHLFALASQSAQTIDVRDPTNPRHAGLLSAGYHYRAVAADDGLAGLAIWGQSDMVYAMLQLVDVRDPRQPAVVFDYRPSGASGFTTDIALDDGVLAFATSGLDAGWVRLFDLADPTAPDLTHSLPFDVDAEAVALAAGRLLTLVVGDGAVWLHRTVVQGGTPSEQQVGLTSAVSKYPDAFMATSDNHAFVLVRDQVPGGAATERRLRLFAVDITQPDRVNLVGASPITCTPSCRPAAIAYGERHVFVASRGEGLEGVMVIDVTDVANPQLVQVLATRTGVQGVALDGDWLFVATGDGGLDVFRRPAGGWGDPPTTPTPVPASPAPPAKTPPPSPSAAPPSPTPRLAFEIVPTGAPPRHSLGTRPRRCLPQASGW